MKEKSEFFCKSVDLLLNKQTRKKKRTTALLLEILYIIISFKCCAIHFNNNIKRLISNVKIEREREI